MTDLNKLEELAKAATQGEWETIGGSAQIRSKDGAMGIYDEGGHSQADANYIAAANPATMQELIALIRRQQDELNSDDWKIADPAGVVARLRNAAERLLDEASKNVGAHDTDEMALATAEVDDALAACVGWPAMPSVATVDTHELVSKMTKWECSERGAPALAAWNEIIAHIDAHVAAQVVAKDAEIKTLKAALDAQGELTNRYQEIALSAQAAAPVVAKQDNPHFSTFPDQIFLQVGDCAEEETSPFDEVYRASDMTWCAESIDRYDVRYIRADRAILQPSPAPVAMTDERIDATWDSLPGLTIIAGQPRSQWDSTLRRAFARAILAAQQEAV